MSNVSIYEKNWTDLVFEDKNKSYGAYQLRSENPKTSFLAFIIGILFLMGLIGTWLLFSTLGNKSATTLIDDDEIVIQLSNYNPPKNEEPKKEKAFVPLKKEESKKDIEKKDLKNIMLVKPNDNPDVIKTNKELKENPTESGTGATNTLNNGSTLYGNSAGTITGTKNSGYEHSVKTTNELDRLPEYPGGIKKFYEYVGNEIEKSEIDNNTNSVSVIMAFVIEKDGSMTDIKVLRSTDKGLEKEAIRVLKSLRVKWAPGYLNGEKVRTQYTLPIKVAI